MASGAITFEAGYDDAVIDAAAKALVQYNLRRYLNAKLVGCWIIFACGYAVMLALGARGWSAILLGVMVVVSAVYWPLVYLVRPKSVARRLGEKLRPTATVTVDHSQFTIDAKGEKASLRLIELKEIVELPRIFLLVVNPLVIFALSKTGMPESAMVLTRRRVERPRPGRLHYVGEKHHALDRESRVRARDVHRREHRQAVTSDTAA